MDPALAAVLQRTLALTDAYTWAALAGTCRALRAIVTQQQDTCWQAAVTRTGHFHSAWASNNRQHFVRALWELGRMAGALRQCAAAVSKEARSLSEAESADPQCSEACRWSTVAPDGRASLCYKQTGELVVVRGCSEQTVIGLAPASANCTAWIGDFLLLGFDGQFCILDRSLQVVARHPGIAVACCSLALHDECTPQGVAVHLSGQGTDGSMECFARLSPAGGWAIHLLPEQLCAQACSEDMLVCREWVDTGQRYVILDAASPDKVLHILKLNPDLDAAMGCFFAPNGKLVITGEDDDLLATCNTSGGWLKQSTLCSAWRHALIRAGASTC